MAIKFEKKVIIGSLFSFLATVVGIIAVFFPDLLNLQKEKVEKLTLDIFTYQDAQKLNEFLSKRAEDEKLFELDIIYSMDVYENQPIAVLDDERGTAILLRNGLVKKFVTESNFCSDDQMPNTQMNWLEVINHCDLRQESYYGLPDVFKTLQWSDNDGKYTMYFFPELIGEQLGYSATARDPISDTPKEAGALSFINIKGIFYLDRIQFSKEGDFPIFKRVSKEQLKLKNY